MSEVLERNKLRLKIPVADPVMGFMSIASDQVNQENPALYETVRLKDGNLSISVIDCDLFLKELRKTEISQVEWQGVKQTIVSKLRTLTLESPKHQRALNDSLNVCNKLVFSQLPNSAEAPSARLVKPLNPAP
jgi:hypothetical protein